MRALKRDEFIIKAIGLVKMRDLLSTCPHWWSTVALAEELGVSQRTVQRWMFAMDEIGCPVEESGWGRERRYRRFRSAEAGKALGLK